MSSITTGKPEHTRCTATGHASRRISTVQEVLDTKAYIDMPNQGFLNFLEPRDIYFGIRVYL